MSVVRKNYGSGLRATVVSCDELTCRRWTHERKDGSLPKGWTRYKVAGRVRVKCARCRHDDRRRARGVS